MKLLKQHGAFLLIFSASFFLRFLPLFDYQFTYDELSGLDRTQFSSVADVLEKGVKVDAHPAFVQLLIYYLASNFGYVNWIIKLPFLLCGQAAILYAYCFGCRNFSKQAGLVAATIFSFSLIFVFYAPIARMYISGVFFSLALLYHFYEIFFNKNSTRIQFFAFGLYALLSALNQHINALFAFTICATGFVLLTRENRKAFLITCLITILLYLPHLPITLYQLSIPGIGVDAGGWLEKPKLSVFFSFLKTLFGTGWTYIVIVTLIFLAFFEGRFVKFTRQRVILLMIFVSNFLIVFLYSLWRSPIFQYSVMLFAATALVLLISSYVDYHQKKLNILALLILTASLCFQTYLRKDYLHQCVKTVFEEQFTRTIHYKKLYGDANVFPVFFDCDTLMRNIYFNKYKQNFPLKISSDPEIHFGERVYYKRQLAMGPPDSLVSAIRLFSEMLDTLKCNFLILSSATPLYQALVVDRFPYLIENVQTQGINIKVYSRAVHSGVADDRIVGSYSSKRPGTFIYPNIELPLRVESANEYPFAVNAKYGDIIEREGQVVLAKARIKIMGVASNSLECCITATDLAKNETQTYSAKSTGDFSLSVDSIVTLYSDQYSGRNSDNLRRNSALNCFIWNRGKEPFKLLSLELKVLDYWPNKWQIWE